VTTAIKLAEYKQAQCVFGLLALYCGFAFLFLGLMGLSAMAPDQYGNLATTYEIEAMASVQFSAAMLFCIGLLINGRWRWSSVLRLIGAGVVTALCAALAYGSLLAPDGWPFAVYLVGFAGYGAIVIWWNLVDLRAAIFWGADDGGVS
jgi:hypothetical protein